MLLLTSLGIPIGISAAHEYVSVITIHRPTVAAIGRRLFGRRLVGNMPPIIDDVYGIRIILTRSKKDLLCPQIGITPLFGNELMVAPLLNQFAMLHNDYPIGIHYGGKAMSMRVRNQSRGKLWETHATTKVVRP